MGGFGFLSALGAIGTGAGRGFVQAGDKEEQKRRWDEEAASRRAADQRAATEFERREAANQGAAEAVAQRLDPFDPIPDPTLPAAAPTGAFVQQPGAAPLGPASLGQPAPAGAPLGPESLNRFASAPLPDRAGRGSRDATPRGSYAGHDKLISEANTAVQKYNAILDGIQAKAAERFPGDSGKQAAFVTSAIHSRTKELEGLKTDAMSKAKQAHETKGIGLISAGMANLQRPGGADFDSEVLPYFKAAGVPDAESYRNLRLDAKHPELMWKADGTPIFRYTLTALADPNLSLKEKVAISEKAHQFLDKWKQFEIQLTTQERAAGRQSRDLVLERFKAAYPETWREELGFALSGDKRGKAEQAAAVAEQRRRDKQMGFVDKEDKDREQKISWINQGYDIHAFDNPDGTKGWIPVQKGEDGKNYTDYGVATRGFANPTGEKGVFEGGRWVKTGERGMQPAARQGGGGAAAVADPLEGKTATNPKTGQKLVRKGGQWVPA